jgi:hypothetical protein
MTKSSLLRSTLLSIAVFTILPSCTTPRTAYVALPLTTQPQGFSNLIGQFKGVCY